jgi:hypothetical protein
MQDAFQAQDGQESDGGKTGKSPGHAGSSIRRFVAWPAVSGGP